MSWARLDDSFPEHPKVVDLTPEAFRLCITAICYSARNLTDGVLKQAWLRTNAPKKLATELAAAGLWDEHPLGYVIHDYLEFNPSRDKVVAERAKRSAAGKRGADNRWHSKSDGSGYSERDGSSDADRIDISDAPDPSPPSGSKDPSGTPRKRGAPKSRAFSPEFTAKCEAAEPTLDIPAMQADYLNWKGSDGHKDIEAGFHSQLRMPHKRTQFTKSEFRPGNPFRPPVDRQPDPRGIVQLPIREAKG